MDIFNYKKTPTKSLLLISAVEEAISFHLKNGKLIALNAKGEKIFKKELPEKIKKLYLIEISSCGTIFRETKVKEL